MVIEIVKIAVCAAAAATMIIGMLFSVMVVTRLPVWAQGVPPGGRVSAGVFGVLCAAGLILAWFLLPIVIGT